MKSKVSSIVVMSILMISSMVYAEKIPVIYDSDIGDDIDDTWAISLLLRSPELDLKLVVGDQGKNQYRAKLFAKILERAGRTDVPIGIGKDLDNGQSGNQSKWLGDYDLKTYPGKVYQDGGTGNN